MFTVVVPRTTNVIHGMPLYPEFVESRLRAQSENDPHTSGGLSPIIEEPDNSGPYTEDSETPRDEDVHHRRRRGGKEPAGQGRLRSQRINDGESKD